MPLENGITTEELTGSFFFLQARAEGKRRLHRPWFAEGS